MNQIHIAATTSYTDVFFIGLFDFLIWAKWLLLLALCLTAADLKFGIDASLYKKKEVRFSRAMRCTINKITGFLLWIAISYTFGQAFGFQLQIPLLPLLMLLIIYVSEIESLYKNYYAAKGKEVKISLYTFLKKKANIIDIEEKKVES